MNWTFWDKVPTLFFTLLKSLGALLLLSTLDFLAIVARRRSVRARAQRAQWAQRAQRAQRAQQWTWRRPLDQKILEIQMLNNTLLLYSQHLNLQD
jgi:hypothetical protein